MSSSSFRQDINLLRALSILFVLFFHFQISYINNGFIGVDIFFVISGFLMTSIIFKGFTNNSFSLSRFYIARFKRIVPALLFLCLVLFTLSYFFIYNYSFQKLIKEIPSTLLFYSNFFFYASKQHYFSPTALSQWLLHTWSLSVEFKFYIFYPIILLTAKKFLSLNKIKHLVLLLFIMSLSCCLYTSAHNSSLAYYMLYTRAWQLLAGALVFLFPVKLKYNNSLQYLSVTLLIIFIFLPSFKANWPNFISIMPILLAMLFLYSNANESSLAKNKFLTHIGLWSYSIYLWHWPIVVFLNYLTILNSSLFIFLGITLSISGGAFSYYFIERKLNTKLVFILLILSTFTLYTYPKYFKAQSKIIYTTNSPFPTDIGVAPTQIKAFSKKYISYYEEPNDADSKESPSYNEKSNNIKTPPILFFKKAKIIVLGDSHSGQFFYLIDYFANKYKTHISIIHLSGTKLILKNNEWWKRSINHRTVFGKASKNLAYSLNNLNLKDKTLIFSSLQTFDKNDENKIAFFSKHFKKVFLLIDNPIQKPPQYIYKKSMVDGKVNQDLLNKYSITYSKFIQQRGTKIAFKKQLAAKYKNVAIIDPSSYYCNTNYHNKKICPIGTTKHSYYFDYQHLSLEGTMRLKPLFEPYFKNTIFS